MFTEYSADVLSRILHNADYSEQVFGVIEMPNGQVAIAHSGGREGIDAFMSIVQYDRCAHFGKFTSIYKPRSSRTRNSGNAQVMADVSALADFKGKPVTDANLDSTVDELRRRLLSVGHRPKRLAARIDGDRFVFDADSKTRAVMIANNMVS